MSDLVYFVPVSYSSLFSSMFTVIVLFVCLTVFINYIYVTVNFEKYQNNPTIISLAWMFGKDPTQMLSDYVSSTQEAIITAQFSTVNNSLNTMEQEIKDVSSNVTKLLTTTTVSSGDSGAKNQAQTANIIDEVTLTTTKNIQSLKDALNKISGALVLNSYMTDGAITASSKFEKTGVYKRMVDLS